MGISDLLPAGEQTALTQEGVTEAVSRHCEFDAPLPGPRARARKAVEGMLTHLMEKGEASSDELVDGYFEPDGLHKPSQLRYGDHTGDAWWRDVAAPQLSALPCVEIDEGSGTCRFTGVDSSDYADEHTLPLEDLRNDPEVGIEVELDDLDVPRRSDERDALLAFWRHLSQHGSATTAELDRTVHGMAVADVASPLEDLSGVEREVNHPPDPEDIEVSTMADVVDGYRELEKDPTETWRFEDGAAD